MEIRPALPITECGLVSRLHLKREAQKAYKEDSFFRIPLAKEQKVWDVIVPQINPSPESQLDVLA